MLGTRRAKRGILAVGGLLIVGGLAWGLRSWWSRRVLEAASRDYAAGRYAVARGRLATLETFWPEQAEVALLLGLCERAAGRTDAALAAWSRVPPGSALADQAAQLRAETAQDQGRLAVAEEVLVAALRRGGRHAIELRHSLSQLLGKEGRFDEVRALIEQNWSALCQRDGPASPYAIDSLRSHLSLDLESYAIGKLEAALDEAARRAPDDDRVRLGQAILAARSGRFDAAARGIDACLESRPGDPVVWRASLDLAMAADQPERADRALAHLNEDQVSPDFLLRLRAWLAAHGDDPAAERAAVEALLAYSPGDAAALERLAVLEIRAGRTDRAAAWRARKAALDRARREYSHRLRHDFQAEAAELARLAETLGRRFEARAFWTMLLATQPNHDEARAAMARLGTSEPAPGRPQPRPLTALLADRRALDQSRYFPVGASGAFVRPDLDFVDEAKAAGLRFRFENGRTAICQLPETMSGGVGLLDYDGDGWLDVYAVQGGRFPPDPDDPPTGDRLFRNRGDGTFEDVTERSGLAAMPRGYGHGVAVGDIDNDGHPDLFLTRWRSYALYRNRGDGTFEDLTVRSGLGGDRDWPTSAAFADLDNDGDLDLYVCHYIDWNEKNPRLCRGLHSTGYSYCAPHLLESSKDHVFKNENCEFIDMTTAAGNVDRDGRGLGVVAADLDGDRRIDLFIANDGTANFFFRNRGGFRFAESALTSGLAGNDQGGYQAGMGIACGDLDGDGRPELVVTNFYGESSTLYQNLGCGLFADRTSPAGLRESTRFLLGFGVALLDVDNDGRLDLAMANGHVNDARPDFPYGMPASLFLGGPGGRFLDVTHQSGSAWPVPRIGRGLAAGDLDNDGRPDLVILSQGEPLAYFHNRSRRVGHFLSITLEGTRSNRDAVGALVTIEVSGRRQTRQQVGGGSYQSSNDRRLHFGLGDATRVDQVEVRWPSGQTDRFGGLEADAGYRLREGDPAAKRVRAGRG
jgi:hypothetical protein